MFTVVSRSSSSFTPPQKQIIGFLETWIRRRGFPATVFKICFDFHVQSSDGPQAGLRINFLKSKTKWIPELVPNQQSPGYVPADDCKPQGPVIRQGLQIRREDMGILVGAMCAFCESINSQLLSGIQGTCDLNILIYAYNPCCN
jgi:hypothetical protein